MLMLPAPRVMPSHPHKHEHKLDPYEAPPGAVPATTITPSKSQTTEGPIKRKLTKEDEQKRELARADRRMRGTRYTRYLDELARIGGNQTMALATVYGISIEEAQERRLELQADVRTGIGNTDVGEILQQNDLDMTARANILRKHAYSDNPAASLKAIDLANDLEGDRGETGSFEQFLRLCKAQE